MKAIYCDISALNFYRSCDLSRAQLKHTLLDTRQCNAILEQAGRDCTPSALKQLNHAGMRAMDRKGRVHVLVPARNATRISESFSYHTWTLPSPRGSLTRINDSCYVVSPETLFVQMARTHSWIELALLGIELCGHYKITDTSKNRKKPLTTPDKLRKRIEKMPPGSKGIRAARKALRYILPGARSAMEAKTMLLLCLPRTAGGYGYPLPEFDHEVPIPEQLRCMEGWENHYCDLFWKHASLDVEYDSDEEHGIEQAINDAQRAATLTALGLSVISLRKGDVFNAEAFDRAAAKIGKLLGETQQPLTPRMRKARANLRRLLLLEAGDLG